MNNLTKTTTFTGKLNGLHYEISPLEFDSNQPSTKNEPRWCAVVTLSNQSSMKVLFFYQITLILDGTYKVDFGYFRQRQTLCIVGSFEKATLMAQTHYSWTILENFLVDGAHEGY